MTGAEGLLPVADRARVRRAALRLVRADGRAFAAALLVNALAAGAGLVGPWLVGRIVDEVRGGQGVGAVDRLAPWILVCALAQLLLARWARFVGYRFGERTLARVREEYVERVLALPASVVERAGTGDLTARGTADVAIVGTTLRDVGPELLVCTVQALFVLVAVFALNPLLGAFGLLGLTPIWLALRWYLRRARDGYLAEGAATSQVAEIVASTAAGARTVEAFGLSERRVAASRDALEQSRRTRFYTLFLRTVFFPAVEVTYTVPVAGVLLLGGWLHQRGAVGVGAVVAAALYLRQFTEPLDQILMRVEQLQSSSASFARVEGLAQAPRGETGGAERVAWANAVGAVRAAGGETGDGVRVTRGETGDRARVARGETGNPARAARWKAGDPMRATRGETDGPAQATRRKTDDPTQAARSENSHPAQADRGETDDPTRTTRSETDDPTQAARSENSHLAQATRGETDGPAQTTRRKTDDPTQAARSEISDPARADRGETDDPAQADRGEADDPARATRRKTDDPTQAARSEISHPARADRGEADDPARATRGETGAGSPVPVDDRIDVRGVRYAYERGGEVLRGVDLTVRPGERLAVVGPSGAGKTTLSRLLAGIDRPGTGTVTVGGVPVAELEPEVLRRQVVLVTQEHHVFLGTVRDNLLIAEPQATDADLWAALATVGADDWVRDLPDGLNTPLGADGCSTDGSQAQQLALARVVLADPHTLILDEATALLDPTTARHAERALAAVLEGRTVIAIAHRLHTAHDADRVAVMENGLLTELGTHEDLVTADGAYAALWRTWHGDTGGHSDSPVGEEAS
ncbi:Vitamin B12 import ATP-binding protein BtuD [Streptomyces sp. RB17]|uniref:ABC transporter transmembrane domain-containing protein n=1 Tax=Streptomyces sp. RB17 TaxID=2585197 RepID=UPI00130C242A|nr:ABC transporter transmembrane domain-containing protein [Streptomyces sp. RB17]MQY39527.1 Vitamin B12 import ATP-binding protein BtuD [Streptomyces sp. RB17]